MMFSHFLGKFKNGPFWPKLTQIWPKFGNLAEKQRFFAFLSKSVHWNLLIFCTKPSLWSKKKEDVFAFFGKIQKWPFWPKLTQIWPKFGHIWLYQAWSTGVQKYCWKKFFFFKIEKKLVRAKKIHILPLWTPLWLPSPHT